MSDTELKQVKVDNWGIYFLQRLKHFFNRTDYCDLTLQFQDNAQLKVHRLVLNACTEYFEILERTCEMYEDCLIMPDDLQADVVVPIVNFMYTGQLEFRQELLEKLYQTSQVMSMPVLSKLLDAQRNEIKFTEKPKSSVSYGRSFKRSYGSAFNPQQPAQVSTPVKKVKETLLKKPISNPTTIPNKKNPVIERPPSPITIIRRKPNHTSYKKVEPRPTRYEVPAELDTDNIFDESFSSLSYESTPLMIHPETSKRLSSAKPEFGIFSEASTSRSFLRENATVDIVECRKIKPKSNNIFEDNFEDPNLDSLRDTSMGSPINQDSNQLFDQVIEKKKRGKVLFEAKDSKTAANIDHAKIISEVLKKYPHLVKSKKNIKLKILDTQSRTDRKPMHKKRQNQLNDIKSDVRVKEEEDYTYESDVINSQEAAKLIGLGAENIRGPWICLICGTPGKALHFPTYFKFRRHLVEVHREKPIPNICEYCGLKSSKRNYLLYHLYTSHNIPPPPSYHFPKCNQCSYIALTQAFLVKHKASHSEKREFRCNVCFTVFKSTSLLLHHIQATGHKFSADRKPNLQCIYCLKVFLRESNLFSHLKTTHRMEAKRDGVVDDSDEDQEESHLTQPFQTVPIKYEPNAVENASEDDSNDIEYQIEEQDGRIQVTTGHSIPKQKILNSCYTPSIKSPQKPKIRQLNDTLASSNVAASTSNSFLDEGIPISQNDSILNETDINTEIEFVQPLTRDNDQEEYYVMEHPGEHNMTIPVSTSEFSGNEPALVQQKILKDAGNINQPFQIVVSNEEEYKALMATNHSIIYDTEGNATKTLAVLTTPQTTNFDSSSNTNDMMILPEYSLNVSEAVPTDNPNIVVVYSHPVDNQNKEFIVNSSFAQTQLMPGQNIGNFVQASAVITPNFATNTTTSAIVSQRIVVPQYQSIAQDGTVDNQHHDILLQQPNKEDNANIEDELPEVQIGSQIIEESQTSGIILTNEEVSKTEMEVDTSIEKQSDRIAPTQEESVQIIEQVITEEQATLSGEEITNLVKNPETIETETDERSDNLTKIAEFQAIAETQLEDTEDESTTDKVQEVTILSHENDKETIVEGPVEIVKEKIQNLTSEWSEDEDEVNKNSTEQNSAGAGTVLVNDEQVEETIENIQQEMEKQISENTGDTITSTQENTLIETEDLQKARSVRVITSVEAPEEVSSLLNDWDDSQEEIDVLANGNEGQTLDTDKAVEITITHEQEPKKAANIKNLVSDWDEDEEESKE